MVRPCWEWCTARGFTPAAQCLWCWKVLCMLLEEEGSITDQQPTAVSRLQDILVQQQYKHHSSNQPLCAWI